MKKMLTMVVMVWLTMTALAKATHWELMDNFENGLSNWDVALNAPDGQGVLTTISNPTSTGPAGYVVKMNSGNAAGKYADITWKLPVSLGAGNSLIVAFDLSYTVNFTANWGHEIRVLDSNGSTVINAGHRGEIPNDDYKYRFYLNNAVSGSDAIQTNETWYHYVLSMTDTSTTLSVYNWISSDPSAYASATPVWTTTSTTAIGTGDYSVQFVNNNSHQSPDYFTSYRDIMYIDNVYMALPEPATQAPTFSPAGPKIIGKTSVTISSATASAAIYYTTDGSTTPSTEGTAYPNPTTVIVNDRTTLRAIAVDTDTSWETSQTYVGANATHWELVDSFENGLSNWDIALNTTDGLGVLATIQNPTSTGPMGNVVKMDSGNAAGKYADITWKSPVSLGADDSLVLAFDLSYTVNFTANWGHEIRILNSSGTTVLNAGHRGNVSSNPYQFYLGSTFSGTSVIQTNETWYHYVLWMSSSSTTLAVYEWISSDPKVYASVTPVWTTTSTTAIGTGDYSIQFVNNNSHQSPDGFTSYRDIMYVDNVYIALPEPATKAPTFSPAGSEIVGDTEVTISSATASAAIYYTTDGSVPTTSGTQYSNPTKVMVSHGTILRAIAVDTDSSWVTSQTYVNASTKQWKLLDHFENGLSKWTVSLNAPDSLGVLTTIPNPNSSGPAGYVVAMDPGNAVGKYTDIQWKSTVSLGGSDSVDVAFDLSYTAKSEANWGHGIRILDSGGNIVLGAGHRGYLVGNSPFQFYLNNNLSGTSLTQFSGAWYHYVLSMASASTTLKVYEWVSSDPNDYTSEMPVWTSTVDVGLGTGEYSIQFANNSSHQSPDYNISFRDTMYVDNVYTTVPQTATSTPVFSPAGPEIIGETQVTISSPTTHATIYYTTDGSEPTIDGNAYSNPTTVTVNHGTTLRAIAVGNDTSCEITQTYSYAQSGAPTFSPDEMFISGPTPITMASTLAGATIYYTDDGTEPSTSNGNIYGGPVTISSDKTLKAVAVCGEYQSKVTTQSFRMPTMPIIGWNYGYMMSNATLQNFQDMRDAGFTHQLQHYYIYIDQVERALEDGKATGIKTIAVCPGYSKGMADFISKVKNHPALEGYVIDDEPGSSEFSSLASTVASVRALDDEHLCYINLLPSTNRSYYEDFLATVPMQFLSFDRYPISTSGIDSNFYQNLEIASDVAKVAGVPLWAFTCSVAIDSLNYPVSTLTHLRFQVYSDLAYGAQAIQYFTYSKPLHAEYHDCPMDGNGNLTATYNIVKAMNEEIKGLSPVFLGAKVVRVRHTGSSIPSGTTQYTSVSPIQSLTTSGSSGAVVSELVNGNSNYLVIINRDIVNTMTLNIAMDTAKSWARVSKGGSQTAITGGIVSYTIEPADIVVLKWSNATSRIPGDANGDRAVDVGDLGILAANYGGSDKTWAQGDFNGDGLVDVGDLGILAANYGTNASNADWSADYAKAFGTTVDEADDMEVETSSICSSLGLPLIMGLVLMGLMLIKLDE